MSHIRYDLLHDDGVIIAPERLRRPHCHHTATQETKEHLCPFCVGNESMTPPEIFSIRREGIWRTRVVPNLYKAVRIEAPWSCTHTVAHQSCEGLGAHEVIIDTPRHLLRMDSWQQEEMGDWLSTLRARLADLRNDIRLVYFTLFKNHGFYAGATQRHPHTQLIALPVFPKKIIARHLRAHRFWQEEQRNPFDVAMEWELNEAVRIVAQNDDFIALCPYASSQPFETMIISRRDGVVSLLDLDASAIVSLSRLLIVIFRTLYRNLGDFDFNLLFNTPPMQKNEESAPFFDHLPQSWRFGIRIIPRFFRQAGFEFESGMGINPVSPEEAAHHLLKGIGEDG